MEAAGTSIARIRPDIVKNSTPPQHARSFKVQSFRKSVLTRPHHSFGKHQNPGSTQ
jgi:hypothetical protein